MFINLFWWLQSAIRGGDVLFICRLAEPKLSLPDFLAHQPSIFFFFPLWWGTFQHGLLSSSSFSVCLSRREGSVVEREPDWQSENCSDSVSSFASLCASSWKSPHLSFSPSVNRTISAAQSGCGGGRGRAELLRLWDPISAGVWVAVCFLGFFVVVVVVHSFKKQFHGLKTWKPPVWRISGSASILWLLSWDL